jgi:hypothetical protein
MIAPALNYGRVDDDVLGRGKAREVCWLAGAARFFLAGAAGCFFGLETLGDVKN